MARIDKRAITRLEIVQEASKQFLEKGYTATTISAISKALEMSPGNLTFHYPTKEHLLAALVDLLCNFQWKMMEKEANEGSSSVMAICLELTTIASICEQDLNSRLMVHDHDVYYQFGNNGSVVAADSCGRNDSRGI